MGLLADRREDDLELRQCGCLRDQLASVRRFADSVNGHSGRSGEQIGCSVPTKKDFETVRLDVADVLEALKPVRRENLVACNAPLDVGFDLPQTTKQPTLLAYPFELTEDERRAVPAAALQ